MSQTKTKVIREAIVLYARYGFDNVSMRELAFETNVDMAALGELFPSKEAMLDSIWEYILEYGEHYEPTEAELREQLRTSTPFQVLLRFCTFYRWENDNLLPYIYRLIYMEQYRSTKYRDAVHRHFVARPTENVKQALDFLMREGTIPENDSEALSQLWNRTAMLFGIQSIPPHRSTPNEQYTGIIEFIIELIVRGVRVLPWEQWEKHRVLTSLVEDINADGMNTRQGVMLRALCMFNDYGYRNVSMPQIAEELELELSQLHAHYTAKVDIVRDLEAALTRGLEQFQAGNPAFDAVMASEEPIYLILSVATYHPPVKGGLLLGLYRLLLREQFLNEELREIFLGILRVTVGTVTGLLESLVQQGRIPPAETEKAAVCFVYTLCSLALSAAVEPERFGELDGLRIRTTGPIAGYLTYGL